MSDVTSVGQLMIGDALPEQMRRPSYDFNKKSLHELFQRLAEENPDRYRDTLKSRSDIGLEGGWTQGASVSLSALRRSAAKERILAPFRAKIEALTEDPNISDEDLDRSIVETLGPAGKVLQDAILQEAKEERSPYYTQVMSGGRGKASDLNSLRGADLLAVDNSGNAIPIPVWSSYAEGFDPAEMFAGAYSQRRGMTDVKLGTASAGYTSKKIVNAAHRQVVTREAPEPTRLPVGLPVQVGDRENVGSVLAKDAGGLAAGTLLTPQAIEKLKDADVEDILIHSPMTELSADGGISRLAAGRRERAGLAAIGDNIGVSSGQTIGEKLSQGMLSAKHGSLGGNKRQNRSGQAYLDRLLDAPENFPEAGPLSEHDGTIEKVEKAPQGGHEVTVKSPSGIQTYYVNPGLEPVVKPGDSIEEGDDLSDGIPHPRDLVRLRGLGEARKVYTQHLGEALKNSGVDVGRRTLESVVGGLLNWARVTNPDGIGDNVVDDIVPANRLTHAYKPRETSQLTATSLARGRYLEEPVLHYTPGTKITRRVAKDLDKWGVKDVMTHEEKPDFEPYWERSVLGLYHDPDWQVRLQGFYTSNAFLDSLHRGGESDADSTSYIPALARGGEFGTHLTTKGTYGGPKVTPLAPMDLPSPTPTPIKPPATPTLQPATPVGS